MSRSFPVENRFLERVAGTAQSVTDRAEDRRIDLTPRYFDADGNPTYIEPKVNTIIGGAGLRIRRGSQELDEANTLEELFTRSVFEWVDKGIRYADTPELPLPVLNGQLRRADGSTVSTQQATFDDVYDVLPSSLISNFTAAGLTRDKLREVSGGTHDSFQDWFGQYVHYRRTQDKLDRYAEENNLGYKISGGIAVVGNLIDPLTIATIGTGAVAGAAKQTASASARAVARRVGGRLGRFADELAASDDILATLTRTPSSYLRNSAAQKLLVGSSGGATQARIAAYAQHATGQRFGDIETDEDLEPGLPTAIGGLLGLGLGGVVARMSGLRPPKLTAREYTTHAPDSFVSAVLRDEVRAGRVGNDTVLDYNFVADLEAAERVATLYRKQDQNVILDAIADSGSRHESRSQADVIDFLSYMPTPDEFRRYALLGEDVGGTRFRAIKDEISDLNEQIIARREARVDPSKLEARRAALLSERAEILQQFQANRSLGDSTLTPDQRRLIAELKDVEILDITDPLDVRADALAARLLTSRSRVATDLDKAVSGRIYEWLGAAGGTVFTNPEKYARRSAREVIRRGELAEADRHVADAYGALDTANGSHTPVDAQGRAVLSIDWNHGLVERDAQEVRSVYEQASRSRRVRSKEQREQFNREVTKAYRDIDAPEGTYSPEATRVAQAYRDFFEKTGRKGIESGYLRRLEDNYFPVLIDDRAAQTDLARLGPELGKWFYDRQYSPDIYDSLSTTPVHLNTLADSNVRYLVHENGRFRSGKAADGTPYFQRVDDNGELVEYVPQFVSDLPEEIQAYYLENLELGLRREGVAAIMKRRGKLTTLAEDPVTLKIQEREGRPAPRYYSENRASRKIEQDFFLQDQFVDSGVVIVDPDTVLNAYSRGAGYNIARSQTLKQLTGVPTDWRTYLNALNNIVSRESDDKVRKRLTESLRRLEQLEAIGAGRNLVQGSDGAAGILGDITRAGLVNPALFLSVVPVEGSVAIARFFTSSGEVGRLVQRAADAMRTFTSSAEMRRRGFGYDVELERNRLTGWDDLGPAGPDTNTTIGKARQFARGASSLTRKWGGEALLTRFLKNINFVKAVGDVDGLRGKLPKLSPFTQFISDPKQFRAAARSAGVRADVLLRMQQAGILTADSQRVWGELLEIDGNATRTWDELNAAVLRLPPERTQAGLDFVEAVRKYAVEESETFVTTATPRSQFQTDNAFANLFFQFQTFARAYYNRTLKRLVAAPYRSQAAYLGVYIYGEMLASMFRDILYGGYTPEQVVERYADNPVEEMSKIVARVPFFGAWNLIPNTALSVFTDQQNQFSRGAPALSVIDQITRGVSGTYRQLQDGKEITPGTYRTLRRLIPLQNFWWYRLADQWRTGFEPDEDR